MKKAGIAFAEDPTNRDPRFARPRLREIARVLAEEGLDAARLAGHARRFARADAALAATVDAAESHVLLSASADGRTTDFNAAALFTFPSEIAIRLLGRAIDRIGDEGPVELGKLESLHEALGESSCRRPAAQAHAGGCGNRARGSPAFGIPRARAALPEGPGKPFRTRRKSALQRAFPC